MICPCLGGVCGFSHSGKKWPFWSHSIWALAASHMGYWVDQTGDDGYTIYAEDRSEASGPTYLIHPDSNGDTVWSHPYESIGFDAGSAAQTSDRGYIFVQDSLTKTDAVGVPEWTLPIAGLSVKQTRDGGYVVVGSTSQDVYLKKLAPESRPVPFRRGHTNDDGRVNIGDAVMILGHVFLGAPLPPPFDTCDQDESEDELGCTSFEACQEP